jgi:hypothetical protein
MKSCKHGSRIVSINGEDFMEKREEIRVARVNPRSLAMFVGLFAAAFGFVVAVVAWLGLVINYSVTTDSLLRGMLLGVGPGLLAVITTVILYYVAGWIVGYLNAMLFNWVAQSSGSMEIATKDLSEPVSQAETDSEAAPARAGSPRRAEPTFGETIAPEDEDK